MINLYAVKNRRTGELSLHICSSRPGAIHKWLLNVDRAAMHMGQEKAWAIWKRKGYTTALVKIIEVTK